MLSLSYTISYELKKSLEAIDATRQKILLTPLQPKYEQKLKWDFLIKKVHSAFLLKATNFDNATIIKLITSQPKVLENRAQQEIIFYKRAFSYISEEWIANPAPVTVKVIRAISNMLTLDAEKNTVNFRRHESDLQLLLEYLQSRPDHPIVLAAIAYIKILEISPSVQNNDLLAQLVATLFIYKYGFDVKELLTFEEFFLKDLTTYHKLIQEVNTNGRLTLWLEYFALAVEQQLSKVLHYVTNATTPISYKNTADLMWSLTERQKDILDHLNEPGANITNRRVQKMFHISQITASRDLTKLTSMGYLLTHGKGRSVYYIKA